MSVDASAAIAATPATAGHEMSKIFMLSGIAVPVPRSSRREAVTGRIRGTPSEHTLQPVGIELQAVGETIDLRATPHYLAKRAQNADRDGKESRRPAERLPDHSQQASDRWWVIVGHVKAVAGSARIERTAQQRVREIVQIHEAAPSGNGPERQRPAMPDGVHHSKKISTHAWTIHERRTHDHDLEPRRLAELSKLPLSAQFRAAVGILRFELRIFGKRLASVAFAYRLDAAGKYETTYPMLARRFGYGHGAGNIRRIESGLRIGRFIVHDVHARSQMDYTIRLQIGRPCRIEPREIRHIVNPFAYASQTLARPPHHRNDLVAASLRHSAHSTANKAIRPCDDNTAHHHLQPNRLKNLKAETANMRM